MNKLKQIFASVLNIKIDQVVNELSPDNCAAWDSLNAIILVTEIEKGFNLKFSFDEVMGVKNFEDAVKLISSKGINLND
jgi:acyl carrier protein